MESSEEFWTVSTIKLLNECTRRVRSQRSLKDFLADSSVTCGDNVCTSDYIAYLTTSIATNNHNVLAYIHTRQHTKSSYNKGYEFSTAYAYGRLKARFDCPPTKVSTNALLFHTCPVPQYPHVYLTEDYGNQKVYDSFTNSSMCIKDIRVQVSSELPRTVFSVNEYHTMTDDFRNPLINKACKDFNLNCALQSPFLNELLGCEEWIITCPENGLVAPPSTVYVPKVAVFIGVGSSTGALIYLYLGKVYVVMMCDYNRGNVLALSRGALVRELRHSRIFCKLYAAVYCEESASLESLVIYKPFKLPPLGTRMCRNVWDETVNETQDTLYVCQICLEDIPVNHTVVVVCEQGHILCKNCVAYALNKTIITCPQCKGELLKEFQLDCITNNTSVMRRLYCRRIVKNDCSARVTEDLLRKFYSPRVAEKMTREDMWKSLLYVLGLELKLHIPPEDCCLTLRSWLRLPPERMRNYSVMVQLESAHAMVNLVFVAVADLPEDCLALPLGLTPPFNAQLCGVNEGQRLRLYVDVMKQALYFCGVSGDFDKVLGRDNRWIVPETPHAFIVSYDYKDLLEKGLTGTIQVHQLKTVECVIYPDFGIPDCEFVRKAMRENVKEEKHRIFMTDICQPYCNTHVSRWMRLSSAKITCHSTNQMAQLNVLPIRVAAHQLLKEMALLERCGLCRQRLCDQIYLTKGNIGLCQRCCTGDKASMLLTSMARVKRVRAACEEAMR